MSKVTKHTVQKTASGDWRVPMNDLRHAIFVSPPWSTIKCKGLVDATVKHYQLANLEHIKRPSAKKRAMKNIKNKSH